MIHEESKKWFMYSCLPKDINKMFIYMEARNCPECEKALEDLSAYLRTRLDTIGKVHRVDVDLEIDDIPLLEEDFAKVFPILLCGDDVIEHDMTNIVAAVSRYLPEKTFNENTEQMLKALKDGKNLL